MPTVVIKLIYYFTSHPMDLGLHLLPGQMSGCVIMRLMVMGAGSRGACPLVDETRVHLAVSCPTEPGLAVVASCQQNFCPDLDIGFGLTSSHISPTSRSHRACLSWYRVSAHRMVPAPANPCAIQPWTDTRANAQAGIKRSNFSAI